MAAGREKSPANRSFIIRWDKLSAMSSKSTIHDGYLRSHDGLAFYYRERLVPSARAQIILVHGVAEHYGRYRRFEEFFAGRGIGFSMMDLRGHGQSEGRRVYVADFEDFLKDLDLLVERVESHAHRIFLVGHSLGGVIALRYAQTRHPEFVGLVTSGAGLKASIVPPRPVFAVLELINKLYPATPVPGLVKPRQICRDQAVVRRYQTDPLVPKYLTTGFGLQALAAAETALDEADQIDLPTLIMHGGADEVADPQGSEELFRRLGVRDKRIQIYAGLYHEIFNEPERERVLTDLYRWIEERV
jgi:alpha-beta hydrolase superfamily lysophospholipase